MLCCLAKCPSSSSKGNNPKSQFAVSTLQQQGTQICLIKVRILVKAPKYRTLQFLFSQVYDEVGGSSLAEPKPFSEKQTTEKKGEDKVRQSKSNVFFF